MNAVQTLTEKIAQTARELPPITVMEVCGTHTHAIRRYGIRQLLPPNIRLVSGPGCPVCVTAEEDVALALALAKLPNVSLFCFGDMLRVPCGDESLLQLSSRGADVRLALSPLDALEFAKEHPARQIVWFGVGFETTTPHSAALLEAAKREQVMNLSVFSVHKTMPNALRALLGGETHEHALLCPGHVAAVTGAEAFRFLPEELRLPAAIAGFEPEELLVSILALVTMIKSNVPALFNAYPRAVGSQGSAAARELVETWFTPCDASWRGLGRIPQSGLALKPEIAAYDAIARFSPAPKTVATFGGCRCGDVLRGLADPPECGFFGLRCTPEHPLGACMVSSEGACAAHYRYEGAGI